MLLRFAPSPTGLLHVGNARVALVNFLLAGGQPDNLVLRFDDTDAGRSRQEYVDGIIRDLHWLGIRWQEEVFQSQRLDLYQAAAERLIDAGRLYPCYETAEDLEYMRRRLRARGLPPIYDRSALKLSDADRAKLEAEGRKPHWRFKLAEGTIAWTDLVRGECRYEAGHLADPVLIREDGTFLYMLPSAVDDADLGITHVIRGEDHVTNTAVQIQIFEALGAPPPAFAHLPLLLDDEGKGLSKRLGSLSLSDLREQGLEPMAVNALLARLGTSEPIEPFDDIDQLVADFSMDRFGRAAPRFDPAELERLNQRIIHALPWEPAQARLRALGCDHADEPFWEAVRGNLTVMAGAVEWYRVVHGPFEGAEVEEADRAFLAQALAALPQEPWDGATWKAWTESLKAATGRKGKTLFLPLRRALTGRDHGPEMSALLPLVGRKRAAERLA
ncbi:glutamate--tRNA ligase [Novispirillum sp. DQ9]|uniref:glutamate--tRNA ligase n=1 Tax=Novispirillum sp. DQ9 TaxID=3398612 RepID=UPI003C7AD4DC